MYINLFPHKHLAQVKRNLLVAGILLILGGAYALFRELYLLDGLRPGWVVASVVVFAVGAFSWLVANNYIPARDAYFSMTPERIKYRLAVFGREYQIAWSQVSAMDISAQSIIFYLTSGKSITMRLGNIQQPEIMLHVSRSLHLAALEKGVTINGNQTSRRNSLA